jgi:hypothetical protein
MNKILSGLVNLLSQPLYNQSADERFDTTDNMSEIIDNECNLIRAEIQRRILDYEGNQRERSRLVYYLQHELSLLSNTLLETSSATRIANTAADQLLEFLRVEYRLYLNENEPVPHSYRQHKLATGLSLAERLHHLLGDVVDYQGLVEIIADFLTQNGYHIFTFAQMNYFLQFADRLERLLSKKTAGSMQLRLLEQLYYINFNTLSFISYCADIFARHANEHQSLTAFETESYHYLRKLAQTPQHVSLAFDQSDQTLRTAIKELIHSELEYREEISSRRSDIVKGKPLIIAHMKVPVLMVLAEAAKAANAFTTETFVDMYAFITNHIRTKNHEGPLSPGAMKNRKNEVDQRSALEAVRHLNNIKEEIHKKFHLS